ncbi:hypothetical protein K9M74_00900 [Candidatus Woesearchaeota archaeon]|nr:hypothetical protein [Candidatus Woesearchaeota archaeon]
MKEYNKIVKNYFTIGLIGTGIYLGAFYTSTRILTPEQQETIQALNQDINSLKQLQQQYKGSYQSAKENFPALSKEKNKLEKELEKVTRKDR